MQHSKKDILNDVMKGWKVPASHSTSESWKAIQDKIESGKVIPMPVAERKLPWKWVGVAAAACFGVWIMLSSSDKVYTEYQTAIVTTRYFLPDSSIVVLNAGSTLKFDPTNYADSREIVLEGEAYFDVRKGEKFSVKSELGNVVVHGTTFTVKGRNESFEVKCFSGKVEALLDGSSQMLGPGEKAWAESGKLNASKFDTQIADWRSGEFYFEDAPLDEVLSEIERQFGVVIKCENSSGKFFSGSFVKSNVSEVLELVSLTMGLDLVECGPSTFCLN